MNRKHRSGVCLSTFTGGVGRAVCLAFALLVSEGVTAQQRGDVAPGVDDVDLLVAGSENSALNERFIGSLQSALGDKITIQSFTPGLSLRNPDTLVISLGPAAMSRVQRLEPRPPQLALLVSESQFAGYAGRSGSRSTAVYQNPPPLAQALLGRLILPQATRVAMLVKPGQAPRYDELARALTGFDLSLRTFTVEAPDQLIPTLARALDYGDFLLGTPDDSLYNARTIKHILLTTYRRDRILVGPHRAFVRAGAIASPYAGLSTVVEAGVRAAKLWLEDRRLPAPGYPDRFAVAVNAQVARSLNIVLPEVDRLESDLKALLATLEAEEAYD